MTTIELEPVSTIWLYLGGKLAMKRTARIRITVNNPHLHICTILQLSLQISADKNHGRVKSLMDIEPT